MMPLEIIESRYVKSAATQAIDRKLTPGGDLT